MLVKILLHLLGAVIIIINFLHKRYFLCFIILLIHLLLSFTIKRWDSWGKARKFSVIALWIVALVSGYTIGHFLGTRSYNSVVNHNNQIIHRLMDKDFNVPPGLPQEHGFKSGVPVDGLQYFRGSSFLASDEVMLSPQQKLHNSFLDYIKLRYYLELRPEAFRLTYKPMKGRERNPLGSSFYDFRKRMLAKSININNNKYEQFSIFEMKLLYAQLIFHYQEGEYEEIRHKTSFGGARAMMDPTIKAFRILAAKNPEDLASTLKAYRNHGGEIARIAKQIDVKKLFEQQNRIQSPRK